MHHFVKEMCTHLHISVTKWCIVGYGTDALWDIWDWSIAKPHTCQERYWNYSYIEECNSIITGSDSGSFPVERMTPNLTMLCSWYPFFHRKWLLLDYWVTNFWSKSGRDWLHQQFYIDKICVSLEHIHNHTYAMFRVYLCCRNFLFPNQENSGVLFWFH